MTSDTQIGTVAIVETYIRGPRLGNQGDKQGPVIDAVKKALDKYPVQDPEYSSVKYSPHPTYTVSFKTNVKASYIQGVLGDIWSSVNDLDGKPVPPANISVGNV